jgi:protein-disulfide isomerase
VVFIWRDLPTVSSYTTRAAEAGQCANAQGKFWEYHDYLYENPQGFYDQNLITYARTIGLDWKKFGGCLINGQSAQKVLSNREQAYKDKVRVTPTFLVNGKLIVGPASFDDLSRAIDEVLKSSVSS